jgi:hypothetical protein
MTHREQPRQSLLHRFASRGALRVDRSCICDGLDKDKKDLHNTLGYHVDSKGVLSSRMLLNLRPFLILQREVCALAQRSLRLVRCTEHDRRNAVLP